LKLRHQKQTIFQIRFWPEEIVQRGLYMRKTVWHKRLSMVVRNWSATKNRVLKWGVLRQTNRETRKTALRVNATLKQGILKATAQSPRLSGVFAEKKIQNLER
jgi:hypothetical protein